MSSVFEIVCDEQGWDRDGDKAVLTLDGGRQQAIHREMVEEDGEQIMRIYSNVGQAGALDGQRMRTALSINYRLRNGALAIREDHLVMVDTFLLREADQDEVRLSMKYIAHTADNYERLIYGTDVH